MTMALRWVKAGWAVQGECSSGCAMCGRVVGARTDWLATPTLRHQPAGIYPLSRLLPTRSAIGTTNPLTPPYHRCRAASLVHLDPPRDVVVDGALAVRRSTDRNGHHCRQAHLLSLPARCRGELRRLAQLGHPQGKRRLRRPKGGGRRAGAGSAARTRVWPIPRAV